MTFLKVAGITKQEGEHEVLHKINFSQKKFQKLAIAGETGSGKSSLLKIIAGLLQPDKGEVFFENKKVEGPEETLVPGHPDIAYLSQHFELAKFLSIEQILSYANSISEEDAHSIYEVCQITHLLDRQTNQISGGERQRIALAKLITSWPKLLLLDEPFSNLDVVHKSTLKIVIANISKKLKITCLLISHDPSDILSWADEILVMKEGQIIQKGIPEKIYKEPKNEYVAGLFGKYNLVRDPIFQQKKDKSAQKASGKSVILRPEDFKIVDERMDGLKGTVVGVKFYGTHYEVLVSVFDNELIVNAKNGNFQVGDVVSVIVSQNKK